MDTAIRIPSVRQILKAAALYFGLAFAAGLVLGTIRVLLVVPRLGRNAEFTGATFDAGRRPPGSEVDCLPFR